jgi:predicted transcriptional regulator
MFRDKIADGFDIRFLIDESIQLSSDSMGQISSYSENWRVTPRIPALFAYSEKSAFVMFPNTVGTYDFSFGLTSDDERFRTWCSDLFSFLWGEGIPVDEYFSEEMQKNNG